MRRWTRLALQVAVAFLGTALVLEGAMRLFGLGIPARAPLSEVRGLRMGVPPEDAPGLWETLAPGGEATIRYPGYRDVPDRDVVYRISEQGLRDGTFAVPKPPWVVRIAVVGDSVTYGTGVQLEDSLPKQLEAALRRALPRSYVEVMNCGVEATNTSQQVALLDYRLLAFEPDLLLWCVTIPDASGRNVERPAEWGELAPTRWIRRLGLTSGRWDQGDLGDPRRARLMVLRRHSVLADTICHLVYARLQGSALEQSYRRDWAPDSPGFQQVRCALERLAERARSRNIPVRVAMYPTLTRLGDDYPFVEQSERLAGVCTELGLPFLDLRQPLRGEHARALHAHPHDRHPNARAHALVAAYWAADLEATVAELAKSKRLALKQ